MSIKISQFPQVGESTFTDLFDSLRAGVNVTTNPALDLPLLTAGENIATGAAICEIGGLYYNAINSTSSKTVVVGFSTTTVTSGNSVYGKRYGHITPLSVDGSNSIDDLMYLSSTAGQLTKVMPGGSNTVVTVGKLTRITPTLDLLIEVYPGVNIIASTVPTANTISKWDANVNLSANNMIEAFNSTVTAAGTTTLLVTSPAIQVFTGTTTQIVALPDATTLVDGMQYIIINQSTGAITVNANGGGLVTTVSSLSSITITLTINTTAAGTWFAPSGITGSSVPTANTISKWDANTNLSANNMIQALQTTVTASSTTTLLVTSPAIQLFTGTTIQTVVLPNATTLVNGIEYTIINNSTGIITVQTNGGGSLTTLPSGTSTTITLLTNIIPAGTWYVFSSSSSTITLPNNDIFVGNASNVATAVAMSGDATITNTGAVTVATATNLRNGVTNNIPYQTAANTTSFISSVNSAVLATNGSGVPSLITTLPAVNSGATLVTDPTTSSSNNLNATLTNINNQTADNTGIPAYIAASTYNIGNMIRGNGTNGANAALYTCNTNGTTGTFNAANWDLLVSSTNAAATAAKNVSLGVNAGLSGSDNIFIGYSSGSAVTTGTNNTYLGSFTGTGLTTSSNNLILSDGAGNVIGGYVTSIKNTFFGGGSIPLAATGSDNTAMGAGAFAALTTGSNNVAMGHNAFNQAVNTVSNAVAIGYNAGSSTTATGNQFFGYASGTSVTSGAHNTYLGAYTGSSDATTSNQIIISDGAGNLGIKIPTSGAALAQNLFLATPNGSTGAASPRAIVLADLPASATPTANIIAEWDGNVNLSANNMIKAFTSTITSATTTTLLVTSTAIQVFTGTTTQTVVLPNATTLVNGIQYTFINESTGNIAIQTFGGASLTTLSTTSTIVLTLLTNGTSAGTWYVPSSSSSGTVTSVSVVSANGFAGTVATATTTPAITLSTTITGILYGNGTAITATAAGTTGQVLTSAAGATPTWTTATATPTASAIAKWDSNVNLSANNMLTAFTAVTTAASTTTLTVSSTGIYEFTGTSTQTVVLPVGSTLANGTSYIIINESTASIIVQNATPTTIATIPSGSNATFRLLSAGTPDTWYISGSAAMPLPSADIYVGNASNVATAVAMSGDATITNTGSVTVSTATNLRNGVAGAILYQSNPSTTSFSSAGLTGEVLTSSGTGAPTWTAATSVPSASTISKWDANVNLSANNMIEAFNSTVTAAGTTTLLVTSPALQLFTGTTTQIVALPDATTSLISGMQYTIFNQSTGIVTVETNGGAILDYLPAGTNAIFTLTSNTTAAGTWYISQNNTYSIYANTGLTTATPVIVALAPLLNASGRYLLSIVDGAGDQVDIFYTLSMNNNNYTNIGIVIDYVYDSLGIITVSNAASPTGYLQFNVQYRSGSPSYLALTVTMTNGLIYGTGNLTFLAKADAYSELTDNTMLTQYICQPLSNLTGSYPVTATYAVNGNYMTSTAYPLPASWLYVGNYSANGIYLYTITTSGGSAGSLTYDSTMTTNVSGVTNMVRYGNIALYACNTVATTSVSIYTIGSGGTLTAAGTASSAPATPNRALIIANCLYITGTASSNDLYGYVINTSTGALGTPTVYNPTGTSLSSMFSAVVSGITYFYVFYSGNIGQYTVNTSTGALTGFITYSSASYQFAAQYNNQFMYAITTTTIQPYTIGSGGALSTTASVITVGTDLNGILIYANFVYVWDYPTNRIYMYSINTSTGALSAIGSPGYVTASGTEPQGAYIFSNAGEAFLYIGSQNTTDLSIFAINTSTGQLTGLSSSPVITPAAGTFYFA